MRSWKIRASRSTPNWLPTSRLVGKGEKPNYDEVLADVNDRDYRDTHRAESPLKQAEDAVVVDNSFMTPDEQMALIYDIFDKACK